MLAIGVRAKAACCIEAKGILLRVMLLCSIVVIRLFTMLSVNSSTTFCSLGASSAGFSVFPPPPLGTSWMFVSESIS